MKQELYNRLATALKQVDNGAVKHVDLWNHNIEFLEQEEGWPRPAVFIEFEPIKWNDLVPGVEYRANVRVRLHIVTDWNPDDDGIDHLGSFELPEKIHRELAGMDGEQFRALDLAESHTNHNHEDLMESIEVYDCVGYKHFDRGGQ